MSDACRQAPRDLLFIGAGAQRFRGTRHAWRRLWSHSLPIRVWALHPGRRPRCWPPLRRHLRVPPAW